MANTAADVLKESFKQVPEGGLVYVPLIIGGEGLFEPHHLLWVTADCQMEQVEYYDPKGTPLGNQKEGSYRLVAGVIAALLRVSRFKRVRENPFRQQKDIHNCGVFDMNDERRLIATKILSHGSKSLMNF